MTLPSVLSSTGSHVDTETTDITITMPATVNAGDVLIATICGYCNNIGSFFPAFTAPSGWTEFVDLQEATGPWAHLSIFAKIADGTEDGTTVTFVSSDVHPAACIITRVDGSTVRSGTISQIFEVASASQSTGEANPPSLTPTWGADDVLWGAAMGGGDSATVSGYPANFTDNQVTAVSTGNHPTATDNATIGQALRAVNAASQDPGTFTAGSNEYVTITWALRGAGAPAVNPPILFLRR